MMRISPQHKDIIILTFLKITIKIKNIQYNLIFMGIGVQDMQDNMLMKEEKMELFLFTHKACMMVWMTKIQVGLFLGKKMIIQYVILILNHFVMTAVGN